MATIVQPYNPWREQLALTALGNVAGSIIGDIWKTHRDNQQNRKINAFRGQLNQDLRDNVSQGQGFSLVPQNLPEGYNSDPWANAFHKTDNPITQFDFGTAGLAQNTQRTPSIRDIMQGVDRLAATPRFSMLGADTVNKIRDDLLQGAYADMFANAGSIGDQMTALAMGAAHGKVPYQVLNAFAPWGIHSTPNHESKIVDAGNNQVVMDYYPKDGSTSVVSVIPKGVNPTNQAVADTNANAHITAANIAANAQRDVANISANARNNNNAGRMVDWHNSVWEAMANGIDKDIATLQSQLDMARNLEEADRINQQIAALNAQKEQIFASYLTSVYNSGANNNNGGGQGQPTVDNNINLVGDSNNTAFNMLGGQNFTITSHFGTPRKNSKGENYSHHGADFAVPKGTPIRLDNFEIPLTVTRVGSDARGYGNYVDAEGKFVGQDGKEHTIGLRWAHLDSVNVSPEQRINFGDLIGKTGNTGNSRGKNGGYHLHLETSIDGRLVNPLEFRKLIAPYMDAAHRSNHPPIGNIPVTAMGGNSTTATRTATDPIVMARGNGQNMEVITQSQLDRLIEEAAKEGYGVIEARRRLAAQGYYDVPEKHQRPQVNPAQNWSPSYMGGGIPQGTALTAPPFITNPALTQNQATPNNNSGTVTALGNNTNSNATPLNRDSQLLNVPIFRDLILRLFR